MLQIVGVAGMVLSFLLSSYLVYQDKMMMSLWAGAAALAFLGLAVLDVETLKKRFGRVAGPHAGPAPQAPLKRLLKAPRREAPSAAAAPARPSLTERFRFTLPQAIELPWSAYLAAAGILLLAGQALVFLADRYLIGWLLTLVSLGLLGNFWNSEQPLFRIPLVKTLPLLLANLGLGLLLEMLGFLASWVQHPYIGFFLILAGTVFLIYGLWWHLELPRRAMAGTFAGLRAFEDATDFSPKGWMVKGIALFVALSLFLAQRALNSYDQVAFATVLATLALVYSFPWSPVDIRALDRFNPAMRRGLSFGLLLLALAIGHTGQDAIYGGLTVRGLSLFLAAILLFSTALPGPSAEADDGPPQWLETALLVALVLLALALRLYKVGQVPVGVEGDEAGYGWWSEELRQGRYVQIFIHAAQGLYWFFAGATFIQWFGVNPLALRLHSVFHGTLGILTFYLFLRLFFSWRTALVTSLLLCFSLWHLHFSRFGHYNVTTHFAQAILFYYLFRAARRQKLHDFILAGVGLSIAAQSHVAARLIPIFMTGFVGYLFVFHRKAFMRLLPGIAIVVISSWVLLSGPWIQFIKNPLWMMGRIKDVSITNDQNSNAPADVVSGVAQSFKLSMLMFNFRGDSRARDFFMAPDPMLDHWTSILFVLGFGIAIIGWRKPLYGFALIAFFGTLLSSVMSVEAPQALRTAGNITFVYLIVGFAVDRIRWGFEEALPRAGRWAFLGAGIAAALWIGNANIRSYWERAKTLSFDALSTEIGMKAQNLGPKASVGFQSESFGYSHPPVFFFAHGTPIRSTAEAVDLLPYTNTDVEKGMLFAFSDRYKPTVETAKLFYPEGEPMNVDSWLVPGTSDYLGWWVSGDKLKAAMGLHARYRVGSQWVERDDKVAFGEGDAPAGATSAEWTGSLYSVAYCQAKVYFETAGQAAVAINGKPVSSTRGPSVQSRQIRLPGGLSRVRITWSGSGRPGRLTWDRDPIHHVGQGYFELQAYLAGKKPVESRFAFHSIKPVGLLQHFYTGNDFKGEALVKVDPILQGYWVSAGYGPIAWRWTGSINVPARGKYQFRVTEAPSSEVWVDKRLVARVGAVRDTWPGFRSTPAGPIELGPGKHNIEVRFGSPGGVNFSFEWLFLDPSGAPRGWELVPSSALEPEDFLG